MSRRHGFTLLEIIIALVIGLMLVTLAVPGVQGLLREQDLKRTFESFDELVHRAQVRSVTEGRAFRIVFDETGATLQVSDNREGDEEAEDERYALTDKETLTIDRFAALVKEPLAEWPFWRSGTCEPVKISYSGPAGSWLVQYDPLTVRGTFLEQNVK